MKNVDYADTKIKGGFWWLYQDLNRQVTVRAVYDRFRETGRFAALKCSWKEGEPCQPHVYWDSDVAKWIEGVAYILEAQPQPEWEQIADKMIEDVASNQRRDGYFNSYFLSVAPSQIYTNRDLHELYCTGHWIEAAIAYHRATGKDTLLNTDTALTRPIRSPGVRGSQRRRFAPR